MPKFRGKCLTWDFKCPGTLAVSHLNKGVTGPRQVANNVEQKKTDKRADLWTQYQFGIETLGPVGAEATAFFQELDRRIAAVTSEPLTMSLLWQRLSVAVQM
jgi:hypothetical protein